MSNGDEFELPKKLDRYLSALSTLYAQDGERLLQEIVVNGKIRVVEQTSYDRWDGGISGHTLTIVLPDSIFFQALRKKDSICSKVKDDLNNLNTVSGEYFEQVLLEIDDATVGDWRSASGVLVVPGRVVTEASEARIWSEGRYRVFLSHKSEVKAQTAKLKSELDLFGTSRAGPGNLNSPIGGFPAH